MTKLRVNLLVAELVETQSWLSLKNVVLTWLAVFAMLLLGHLWLEQQLALKLEEYQELTVSKGDLEHQIQQAQNQLDQAAGSEAEIELLNILKSQVKTKTRFYQQLELQLQKTQQGFSKVMNELANFHHPEISLSTIRVNNLNIELIGEAKEANSVPLWLSGFEQSDYMKKQRFQHFTLVENEQGQTQFKVSSDPGQGEVDDE
ncbi:PilN domain-containing protein [Thalassotalea aquiviva]|uniref:PilN domain-containing protein n=1 Tax=Thalassotalea aquiviva TaxID=3242415 RepID=UPI003529EFE8